MPLITIDLLEGRSTEELDAISGAVHDSMVELLGVPQRDRFQIITEHTPRTLRFDRSYLDIDRDAGFILVRITLAQGRTTEAKRAFYKRLSELLADRARIRPQNLAVVMTENGREDWSFGGGQANYLDLPREAWR
jgi:4-oxalocrotonate tautomerase